MPSRKKISTTNAIQLAKALGLKTSKAYEWEVQTNLYAKLKSIIEKENLTHDEIAKKVGTSRTRITSILNGNLQHVSTDMLIRILGALGYSINVSIAKVKNVA